MITPASKSSFSNSVGKRAHSAANTYDDDDNTVGSNLLSAAFNETYINRRHYRSSAAAGKNSK